MKHPTLRLGLTYFSGWGEQMDMLLQRISMVLETSLLAPLRNKETSFGWLLPKWLFDKRREDKLLSFQVQQLLKFKALQAS